MRLTDEEVAAVLVALHIQRRTLTALAQSTANPRAAASFTERALFHDDLMTKVVDWKAALLADPQLDTPEGMER